MFARTMRRAAGFAARKLGGDSAQKSIAGTSKTEQKIIAMLENLPEGQDYVVLRTVHSAIDVDQPSVLKAVRNLARRGIVQVDQVLHDPLASRMALATVTLPKG